MATVSVRLPSLLTSLLKVPKSIVVSGDTLDQALDHLFEKQPSLALHLYDESGKLREHILCFVNETNSRDVSDLRLRDGDDITFLQAVSGG